MQGNIWEQVEVKPKNQSVLNVGLRDHSSVHKCLEMEV